MKESLGKKKESGFTLMEVLISIFLMSIVLLGIFGAFQLIIKTTAQSKARMQGVYLASQRIEELKNLPYSQIQTSEATTTINNVVYDIQTVVEEVDDCADNTIEGLDCNNNPAPADVAPNDYKQCTVKVFWQSSFGGETDLSTNIASKSLETGEGKGALRVSISDSLGQPLDIDSGDQLAPCSPNAIHIINNDLGTDQCYGTDVNDPGRRLLILDTSISPNDYKIIISKQEYNSIETFKSGDSYGSSTIITPLRKNPTINQGEVYPITFIIDKLSDLTIKTLSSWGGGSFFDSFLNEDKISEKNNITINNGQAGITSISPGIFFNSGYLLSNEIIPDQITSWYQLSFSDFEDLGTNIGYQLYYATSTNWQLIPDQDLPGNLIGFDSSPVDLSGLDPQKFFKLKIKANLSTNDSAKSPVLYDWDISWKNSQATPISGVNFSLRGDKTVGTDFAEQPIYKYSDVQQTDANGLKNLSDIETDNYYFSEFNKDSQTLNLNSTLSPNPFFLLPGTSSTALLYLEADNSLLVKVQNASTSEPIFGATIKLTSSSLGFEETQNSNDQGEALFIPLQQSSDYNLQVQATNYYEKNYSITISGEDYKTVGLERYE